ncbi:MAG: YlxR family protein [Clostridia bacterium]|nr:YlxR family protein [Clostridia bacterium]
MPTKKIPMRMCLSCREMTPKKQLLRIVKNAEGDIFVDDTFKANGRGAYLCKSKECIQKCIKQKMLNKQFECAVDAGVYEALEKIANEL